VYILGVDTCDQKGSVSLLTGDAPLTTLVHSSPEDYSTWLLPAIAKAREAAGVRAEQVDLYAVASGPGSFTGVRVGLTAVKALAEVYEKRIVPVSRLEALASQSIGKAQLVAAFADARRDQIFAALYRRTDSLLQLIDEQQVIDPERFISWVAEMAQGQNVDWISTWPECVTETESWTSRRAAGEWVQRGDDVLAPIIGNLAYKRALNNQTVDALAVDANYVRRSDAEIFWKGGAPSSIAGRVPVTVRVLQGQDIDPIREIALRSPEAAQWSRMAVEGHLAQLQPGWVAEQNGAVIGFLLGSIAADQAEILNVAIAPEKRRSGHASALMEHAVNELRGHQVSSLHLEVRESNRSAIQFYEKHGFAAAGRRPNYYREPDEAAVLMTKKLTA
jgi:tRNA threonylcarbamoyl adenosine modification protein YeaZ/ribosomal-protein-alanine acetyltransferase